jgi:alginate O-acetyltransferase complex protein AlgI
VADPGILLSIVVNYWLGVAIHRAQRGQIRFSPQFILGLGVVLNLAVLGYFKYANFFVNTTNSVWALHWNVPAIFLPLAISFFTFTQIAYLVDAYHGVTEAYDFLYYALFVSFFPHLIAGPIVSYRRLMPQFAETTTYRFHAGNFAAGLSMFTFGLAKKVIIADNLAILPQTTFDNLSKGGSPDMLFAWLGTLAYTFQLYFDFSGYSDMAIGLAKMFNVRFPLNFNSPYKALDIADFWRRWHMTLSQFLRDQIYIPLGGNRHGEPRRYLNLMTTMLLGGLWHGAGWNFVIWGGLHGLYLIIHRTWEQAVKDVAWAHGRGMVLAGRCLTFLTVALAWVFFRSHGLRQAMAILGAMVHPLGSAAIKSDVAVILHGSESLSLVSALVVLALATLIVFLAPNTDEIFRLTERYTSREHPSTVRPPLWQLSRGWALSTGCLLTLAILYLSNPSEFLYFRF